MIIRGQMRRLHARRMKTQACMQVAHTHTSAINTSTCLYSKSSLAHVHAHLCVLHAFVTAMHKLNAFSVPDRLQCSPNSYCDGACALHARLPPGSPFLSLSQTRMLGLSRVLINFLVCDVNAKTLMCASCSTLASQLRTKVMHSVKSCQGAL